MTLLAATKHAFAIPRRACLPARRDVLVQWSQWNVEAGNAPDSAVEDEPPSDTCGDTSDAVTDFLGLAAIDAFIDTLPGRARSHLAAAVAPYQSSRHSAAWVLVFISVTVLVGALLATLESVGFVEAAWLGALAGSGADVLVARAWQRHTIRQYLRRVPTDWVLTPCPVCRYDQRGASSPRCPECGCPVRIERPPVAGARELFP